MFFLELTPCALLILEGLGLLGFFGFGLVIGMGIFLAVEFVERVYMNREVPLLKK